MPPAFIPGGAKYAGEEPGIFMDWVAGDYVCGRLRGQGVAIWEGVSALGMRTLWPGSSCDSDTSLDALVGLALIPTPGCDYNGPVQPGNIFDLPITSSLTYDRELIGFTILEDQGSGAANATLDSTAIFNWTGLGPIGPVTLGDATFPEAGPGGSNLVDGGGGTIVILKFTGSPDMIPLYVAVVAGASAPVGLPSAPGWDLVMTGTLMSVFTFAGAGGGGSGLVPPATSDVVTDLCVRAGLDASQCDVTLLQAAGNIQPSPTVMGYLIERPTQASAALKVLMETYFFDGCESDGAMRWVPRGLASKLTIPEADLGLLADKAKIKPEQILQAWDLPKDFSVLFNDITLNYQQGRQLKGRNVRIIKTKQQSVIEIPMTMTPDWARQVAEKALYLAWLERAMYSFNLWRAVYMQLDPTDVIEFLYEALTFEVRIGDASIGQGFASALNTINANMANYLSQIVGGGGVGPGNGGGGGILIVAPTTLFLFDLPLLSDADANSSGSGFYRAFASLIPSWQGAVLFSSTDDVSGDYTEVSNGASATRVDFGYATNALGTPRSPWTWDRVNTLTVKMSRGTPASATALAVLNGANQIIVGSEVIQFQNAVQNTDGTWTLSILLRGRRGTEWAASGHAATEPVAFVASGVQHINEPLSFLNIDRFFRAVSVGQDITTAASQELEVIGRDRMPYAPVHIAGSRDISGNLTVTWTRRTRIGGEWVDGTGTVPLSEDSELYQVDILNGSTVVRSEVVPGDISGPRFPYSSADQTTDFGSPQASVDVRIFQVSGEVGKGFPSLATV